MSRRFRAIVVGLGLVGAACGGGSASRTATVSRPGVAGNVIRVGAVASVTNPIGGRYSSFFDGIDAYFRMVDAGGGVNGEQLELVARRDDQTVQNQSQVLAMLLQDNVFATMVATLAFTGADLLVQRSIPTFGWNVNTEWQKGPNLFGDKGSYFNYNRPLALVPWLARELQKSRVAILSYNIAQSAACANGVRSSFEMYGGKVVFFDTSLPLGVTDLSADVAQMKKQGAQFVLPCVDQNGSVALAREMRKQGLQAPLYLPNAYNQEFVSRFAQLLDGSYVMVQFWPFEAADRPDGLRQYMTWMGKAGKQIDEISLSGWISADMLATGLRAAGPPFTRQAVIDQLNQLTDYDASGILPGIDWTVAHTNDPPQLCYAMLQIVDGRFEPRFGAPGKPFICFDRDSKTLPAQPALHG